MDRRKEDSKVAAIPSRINPVRKAAVMREQRKGEPLPASLNSPNPPIKNREISIMSVGNLPLQGTREFVRMAIRRSLGESIIRHPTTPAALQPKPIAMRSHRRQRRF